MMRGPVTMKPGVYVLGQLAALEIELCPFNASTQISLYKQGVATKTDYLMYIPHSMLLFYTGTNRLSKSLRLSPLSIRNLASWIT